MIKTNCPSIVMGGIFGFYILASGAIQDHLGPLVLYATTSQAVLNRAEVVRNYAKNNV